MLQTKGKHNQLSAQIVSAMNEERDLKESRSFYRVSETTMCARKLAYGKLGIQPSNPFDARIRSKMQMGDALHDWVRGILIPGYTGYDVTHWDPDKTKETFLLKTFVTTSSSITGGVTTEVTFGGHIDGILRAKSSPKGGGATRGRGKPRSSGKSSTTQPQGAKEGGLGRPPGDGPWLLEVKTAGGWSYGHVKKLAFADRTDYSFGYVRQANRYVRLWNDTYPKDPVMGFVIFVVNTDGKVDPDTRGIFRDYWFEYDEELFQQDLILRARIERRLDKNELPERLYLDPTGFECSGCLWEDACWNASL